MPWFSVAMLTDRDLNAVFAYLKSVKPIRNEVSAPLPAIGCSRLSRSGDITRSPLSAPPEIPDGSTFLRQAVISLQSLRHGPE